jgi:release factor glutamine methyltransferase
VAIVSLGDYLKSFYEEEKKSLLLNYPGLTLHRLKQDIKLHAFLNGIDSEELFDFPYLPFQRSPITQFIQKLNEGVPLEYITGYAYFYRSHFKVTKNVLIPRSETEILVELATQEIKKNYKNKTARVADIGTGSGIIALTLMMECNSHLEVVASDISDKALAIAKENYFNLCYAINPKHKIEFVKSDRLQSIEGSFDLILSNPPYIKRRRDIEGVHQQVKRFEPHMALFIEDDIYDLWFEDFLRSIYRKLNANGLCLIEGHESHLNDLAEKALDIGFAKVDIVVDYTGRNRFLNLRKTI